VSDSDAYAPYAGGAFPTPGQPLPLGPDEWQPSHSPTVVTFGHRGIDPPSAGYIQAGDLLVCNVCALATFADTVTLTVRLLLPEAPLPGQPDGSGFGDIPTPVPTADQLLGGTNVAAVQQVQEIVAKPATVQQLVMQVAVAAGAQQTVSLGLPEGYLLSVAVSSSTATKRGATFVRAWVQHGSIGGAGIHPAMLLLADYVTQFASIGWPLGRVLYPTEGPGIGVDVAVGSPGAGADWTVAVPAASRWRVSSWSAQLVTSAAVATRIPRVVILSTGAVIVWQSAPQQGVPASQTVVVSSSPTQVQSVVDTNTLNLPLPSPCILFPGQTLKVVTAAIQAADQWSSIVIATEQWSDAI
jgi:hypothetical protein